MPRTTKTSVSAPSEPIGPLQECPRQDLLDHLRMDLDARNDRRERRRADVLEASAVLPMSTIMPGDLAGVEVRRRARATPG